VFLCAQCNELLPSSLWARLSSKRFYPQPNTYHVTDLTNCLSKAYLDRTLPIEEPIKSTWSRFRGSLIHYAGRSLGWNELPVKMVFQVDGQSCSIVGHIDAYDPETATIYDLKTTRFVNWQCEKGFIPRETHVAQMQCYYTLMISYDIPVSRLVLVYVDDSSIVAKQVSLGSRREWMIRRATVLHRALRDSQPSEPEPGSACRYCAFACMCSKTKGATELMEQRS